MEYENFEIIITSKVEEFLNGLSIKARIKILSDIRKACYSRDNNLFKKLVNTNIWEFRTEYARIQYRILAFWDKNKNRLVVTTHGFIKKSQKTPQKEIKKAEQIMKLYYENNR